MKRATSKKPSGLAGSLSQYAKHFKMVFKTLLEFCEKQFISQLLLTISSPTKRWPIIALNSRCLTLIVAVLEALMV